MAILALESRPGRRPLQDGSLALAPQSRDQTAPTVLAKQLSKIGAGDRSAMRELYVATSPKLFGIVLRILADRYESEDILQDVYLAVWRRALRYDAQRGPPMSWLITMARNRAIDRLRRQGTVRADGGEAASRLVDPDPCALTQVEKKQEAAHLQECLSRVEPRGATALRMAFYDGDTYAVVAKRLGVPEGTAKSLIRRRLLDLRSQVMPR